MPSQDYSVNLIDGIRVSFRDGWALARASNTQPVLVLRFRIDIAVKVWTRIQKSFEDVVQLVSSRRLRMGLQTVWLR